MTSKFTATNNLRPQLREWGSSFLPINTMLLEYGATENPSECGRV